MDTLRPRILMLAALFAIFPLMLSFMPITGAAMEGDVLFVAIFRLIAGLGVSGLILAFRKGSLVVLLLFWLVLLGGAVWMYPSMTPKNVELETGLYFAGCAYLLAGLGLTLAAQPFSFRLARR